MSAQVFSTQLLPPAAVTYAPSPYVPLWNVPAPMPFPQPPQQPPAPYVLQFAVTPPMAYIPQAPVNFVPPTAPTVIIQRTPDAFSPLMTPSPHSQSNSPIVLDCNLLHSPADGARPVLVERFHTKLCRNHLEGRKCPYRSRCMFAHSEAELRTPEMNFRDSLFTEAAIRAFQQREEATQRRLRAQQQRHRAPADVWPAPSPAQSSTSSSSENAITPSRSHHPYASRPVM